MLTPRYDIDSFGQQNANIIIIDHKFSIYFSSHMYSNHTYVLLWIWKLLIEINIKYKFIPIWCIDYYNNNHKSVKCMVFCLVMVFKRRVKCQKCTAINNFHVNFSVSIIYRDAALWWWVWENNAYFLQLLIKKMCTLLRRDVFSFS